MATSMDEQSIRATVLSVVRSIAPELDPDRIDAAKPLREQIDLDSMDWLNVIIGLQEKLQIEIPEADYGKLPNLNALVAYLCARLSQSPAR